MSTAFSHPSDGGHYGYYTSSAARPSPRVAYFRPLDGALIYYYAKPITVAPVLPDTTEVFSTFGDGDVLLRQTPDDGDIEVRGGLLVMQGGLETAVYLSMFGGNEDDEGGADETYTWWGNTIETQSELKYRSETQNLLQSIPAIPINLLRVEDAAKRDLAWMVPDAASSVSVSVSIPALNTVSIVVSVEAEGEMSQFKYVENWKART